MTTKATMVATRYTVPKKRHRETRRVWLDCVLSITASPVYCLDFGSGDVRSAPARRAPEIPERIERTPGISSAVAAGAAWPGCEAPAPAFALSSGAVGVAAPEVPGGGLFGGDAGGPGVTPGAVDALGGALLDGAGGGALPIEPGAVDVDDGGPLAPACGCPPGGTVGTSALPRMIGSPSLPVPMTTIFAFGDWASSSVASMPRQRRYDSEMPWLTVF